MVQAVLRAGLPLRGPRCCGVAFLKWFCARHAGCNRNQNFAGMSPAEKNDWEHMCVCKVAFSVFFLDCVVRCRAFFPCFGVLGLRVAFCRVCLSERCGAGDECGGELKLAQRRGEPHQVRLAACYACFPRSCGWRVRLGFGRLSPFVRIIHNQERHRTAFG